MQAGVSVCPKGKETGNRAMAIFLIQNTCNPKSDDGTVLQSDVQDTDRINYASHNPKSASREARFHKLSSYSISKV